MMLSHTMIYYSYNDSNREMDLLLLFVFFQRSFLKLFPPAPTLLHTESWMKEDVQDKIKYKQDQPAHCGFMRVKYEKDILQRIKILTNPYENETKF